MNTEGKVLDRKRLLLIGIPALCVLIAAAIIIGIVLHNRDITAVTMRLQRLVGTVNLYNERGKEQSIKEEMRLLSGQSVTTADESLIMVSLDDIKLLTMEQNSRADIKAKGKALKFELTEGNLFFNVTQKLEENESFDIHTSTMICGIRGTSAYVGVDSTDHEVLMVTDGVVKVTATNPRTGETLEVEVPAGQMITVYLDEEAETGTISIKMRSFREEDLPALALDTIQKNKALADRIAKATGFRKDRLTALANVSTKAGISMYGEAAKELESEGIKDAIPLMGQPADEMVTAANNAVDIAKEDLPLEVAIITGLRDVLDVGLDAGYRDKPLTNLMDSATDCVEQVCVTAEDAGVSSTEMITLVGVVTDTVKETAVEMTQAGMSADSVSEVIASTKEVFTTTISEAAADNGSAASIIAAVTERSDFVKETVSAEVKNADASSLSISTLLETPAKEAKAEPETPVEEVKAEPAPEPEETPAPIVERPAVAEAPAAPVAPAPETTEVTPVVETPVVETTAPAEPAQSSTPESSQTDDSSSSGSGSSYSGGGYRPYIPSVSENTKPTPTPTPTPTPQQYSITVNNSSNGGVSVSKTSALKDETITLTITPDTGYELDVLTVKDGSGTSITVSNNSFIMPEGNVTVNATFKAVAAAPVAHSITVSQTTNGTVTASASSAAKDTEITLTVTPATGYEIDTLTVNGTAVTDNKFTMPDEDVTVAATFKQIGQVATPVITYTNTSGDAEITITCATDGATIYYTRGSGAGPEEYNSAITSITLREAGTITAYATKTGMIQSENASATFYKVDFDRQNHGTTPSTQIIKSGDKVAKPADLSENGQEFGGWYKEAGCTNAWGFDADTVDGNRTLYAKWTPIYTITVSNSIEHGTVQVVTSAGVEITSPTAKAGDIVYLLVTPDPTYVNTVLNYTIPVQGMNPIPVNITTTATIGNQTGYSFEMPSGNVTINAEFVQGSVCGDFTVIGGTQGATAGTGDFYWDETERCLSINTSTALTIKNTDSATATTTDWIKVNDGTFTANITLAGVNIQRPHVQGVYYRAFQIPSNRAGDVNITLDGDNILKGGCTPGLEKNVGANSFLNEYYELPAAIGDTSDISAKSVGILYIREVTGGGKLYATGDAGAAGIGGQGGNASAGIVIESGTIVAQGGSGGAGIGGGSTYPGIGIFINGGDITATGGAGGAGIGGGVNSGGGCGGSGQGIIIAGGIVSATGGEGGAGIGGGAGKGFNGYGSGKYITISGGTVHATGGSSGSTYLNGGAGIGGGGGANDVAGGGNNITITDDAIVRATGGNGNYGGSGIGGGGDVSSNYYRITILDNTASTMDDWTSLIGLQGTDGYYTISNTTGTVNVKGGTGSAANGNGRAVGRGNSVQN